MERRYEPPTPEDFAACEVPRNLPDEIQKHFRELATPFGDLLESDTGRYYFHAVLEGLAAKGRKNLESIAYAHDHDRQMYQGVFPQTQYRAEILGPQATAQGTRQTSRRKTR